MYQKQEIVIDKNSAEAMKFYEEEVKGYIDYIENNRYSYTYLDEEYEDHVKYELDENDENGKLMIRLEEDWTLIFRNRRSVSEEVAPISDFLPEENIKFKRLIRAYLEADEKTKAAVHFRYARRTVKECDGGYTTNVVEVFDSDYMDKVLDVRCDDSKYLALPVENYIPLSELPQKKWYLAKTWIMINRCTGMMGNPEIYNIDDFYYTMKETTYIYSEIDDIPLSDEVMELVEQSKKYEEEFRSLGNVFVDYCENDWVGMNHARKFFLSCSGEMMTDELIRFVDVIDRFRKNSELINGKCGCDVSSVYNTTPVLSIMMYSDDYDAVEVILTGSSKIACRFYENGKTPIVDRKKIQPEPKPAPVLTEEEKIKEKITWIKELSELSGWKNLTSIFNYPELADIVKDLKPADDFEGEVSVDGPMVKISSFANRTEDNFFLAFYKYPEKFEKIRSLISYFNLREQNNGALVEEQRLRVNKNCTREDKGIELKYNGKAEYTCYKDFINDISDSDYHNIEIRKLWVGMEHECSADEFAIPHKVGKLGDVNMQSLNEIHISPDCRLIATEALIECESLKDAYIYSDNVEFPDDEIFTEGTVIHAHKGSTSEAYAARFGYGFAEI